MSKIQLNPLGTYATDIFDASAAEIVVHDPQTQRLFVVNASTPAVDVLDISDPTNPTKLFSLDPSAYGATANSVAVLNGIVAVAIDSVVATDPGSVVFFDTDGNFLNAVTVGALPDMLLFTPDGTKVLVANEGEPNSDYTIDPEGSVSIIDISGGITNLTQGNVTTADFRGFNDQKEALIAAGVRIFGPNATVGQDVEPEYIVVSSDSRTAYVALQENNAIGVVDIESGTVTDILPLGYKLHGVELFTFDRTTLPAFDGTTSVEPATSGEILLGGLSGMFFEGITDSGNLQFIGVPDRNPSSTRDTTGDGSNDARVFPFADAPTEIVRFEVDRNSRQITVTERVQLFREDGTTPVTRLPNLQGDDDGLTPIAPDGTVLDFDPYGADFEGVLRTDDGSYWLVDEYRPAIYHFNAEGILVNRFVAQGTAAQAGQPVGTFGSEVLPAEYALRTDNRGFEGLAYQDGKVFAFTQSPLNNPSAGNSEVIRIVELDVATSTTTGEYLYVLEGGQSDKIGDAVSLGEGTGEFLVIERDSAAGRDSIKNVFRINLAEATNLMTVDASILPAGATFDSLSAEELQALGINLVGKTLEVDLAKIGYDFVDKPEGLALIDAHTIAVLNDNDFESGPSVLGLIDLRSVNNPLDASDRDGGINITNYPNLYGTYHPDAIAITEINGQTYIVTANEGDARDYDGFSEEARVKDLVLDRDAFPHARELQADENLGRLTVTRANGISDGVFFQSNLTGAQEAVPVTTDASGSAVLKLNQDRTALSYELTVEGLDFGSILGLSPQTPDTADDVTMLHLHEAAAGANGSVVFGILSPNQDPDLSFTINQDGSTTLNGIWRESDPANKSLSEFVHTLTDANIGDEVELYFNVHTQGNPGGEIRGQLTSTLAYNELYAFGGRSFGIWDTEGNLVYDSGADFEQITAELFPDNFNSDHSETNFDNRSDNKGPEPEGVTIGEIDGRTYAFVGLERLGGVMTYDITNPAEAFFVNYTNNRDFDVASDSGLAGDLGAEGVIFIPAADSPNGEPLLVVGNEVSGTTTLFEITQSPFTLQLFHFADQEAAIPAFEDAPRFSAVLNALKAEDLDNDGVSGFDNTLILSSGDAYIPGLFLNASESAYGGVGRGDILIQNALGVQAMAFGNHEFDFGTEVVRDLIAGDTTTGFPGTAFPYLSSNLDFSTDTNLADLVVADAQAPQPNSIAGSVVIDVNGEKIGVVGATTPTLGAISSPGDVTINPQPFNGNPTSAQLDALAAEIQADVDALLVANPDINKVVLLSHMQQLAIEQQLATRLSHVDIIVAGGSNTRLVDETDRLRAGDTEQGTYPIFTTDADGKPVAVVNTDGNYKYLGRLVIDFDADGVIIPESYNPEISGAYATDAQGVADLGAEDLVDPQIQEIVDTLRDVVVQQEGNVFGISTVYLNGDRTGVRRQETNLGNLTADANLAIAKEVESEVVISLKNAGGIRNSIGRVVVPTGSTGEFETLPNEAVTDADGNIVKPEGGISENDIANALSFNNGLTLVTVTATELLALAEHAIASATSDDSATPGSFPQVAGFSFSFDLTREPGNRVLSLAIEDETGKDLDVVVTAGEIVGDPNRTFRMVTLSFLAGGGDGYPFPQGQSANRVDLTQSNDAPRTGNATFAPDGSEQDALAEYLFQNFLNTPFSEADTPRESDQRLQNLAFRADTVIDTVIEPLTFISGTPGTDNLMLTSAQSGFTVFTGDGDDEVEASQTSQAQIYGGGGDDTIFVGSETYASGGDGDDTLILGAQGATGGSVLDGGKGNDTLLVIEAAESNILLGGADNDNLQVAEGRGQMLFGGSSSDVLRSSPDGHNRLYGGSGDDTLYSTVGDRLFGGDGDDSLYAGQGGNNLLWGGAGADSFWLVVDGSLPHAPNVVKDFEIGVDRIGMGGITSNQVSFVNQNGNTLMQIGDTDIALLEGVSQTQLDLSNGQQFVFI